MQLAVVLSKKGNNIFGMCESKIPGVILFAKIAELKQMLKNYIIRSFILSPLYVFAFTADVSAKSVTRIV